MEEIRCTEADGLAFFLHESVALLNKGMEPLRAHAVSEGHARFCFCVFACACAYVHVGARVHVRFGKGLQLFACINVCNTVRASLHLACKHGLPNMHLQVALMGIVACLCCSDFFSNGTA